MNDVVEVLRTALADIAFSTDMTLEIARSKAARIYGMICPMCEGQKWIKKRVGETTTYTETCSACSGTGVGKKS